MVDLLRYVLVLPHQYHNNNNNHHSHNGYNNIIGKQNCIATRRNDSSVGDIDASVICVADHGTIVVFDLSLVHSRCHHSASHQPIIDNFDVDVIQDADIDWLNANGDNNTNYWSVEMRRQVTCVASTSPLSTYQIFLICSNKTLQVFQPICSKHFHSSSRGQHE